MGGILWNFEICHNISFERHREDLYLNQARRLTHITVDSTSSRANIGVMKHTATGSQWLMAPRQPLTLIRGMQAAGVTLDHPRPGFGG